MARPARWRYRRRARRPHAGRARDLAVPETGDAGGNVMRRQKGAAPTPERVSSTRGGSR